MRKKNSDNTESKLKRIFERKQNNIRKRNIPFELSFAEYTELRRIKRCYYTGRFLSFRDKDGSGKPGPFAYSWSMDRIDVSIGYTKDNVVPCAHIVNLIKSYIVDHPTNYTPKKDQEKRIAKAIKNKMLIFHLLNNQTK